VTTRGAVRGLRGAIATSNYLASEAGMHALRHGGNCVDAAICAAAVLNVVEPHCSHLGGDAFCLVWDAGKRKLTAVNSSGAAPMLLTRESFCDRIPESGFLSSTVPGQVAAWDTLLSTWGTMAAADVLGEAIHYAREGFVVSRDLSDAVAGQLGRLEAFPDTRAVFAPGGAPVRRGQVLRQPALARTLEALATGGLRAFYEGEIGERIAAYWEANGGALRATDLAAHQARVLEPLRVTYRGFEVCEQPPVSQGHILLQSLNLAEMFDLGTMGHLSAEVLHVCIEANKLAHADKDRYTTDPSWSVFPEGLLSKTYAADRARLIDPDRATPFPPAHGVPPGSDTTYLCCVDGLGNAISYIQSIFHGFGCGALEPSTGVILNNRACGFSLEPGHVNCVAPGKKTVHTLNTYMVFRDGRPAIVGGTPGGDVQVQTNLQVLTGLIDFGRDPQQAAEDPRWQRGEGLAVGLETRAPSATQEGLRTRGHQVARLGPYSQGGRVQVVTISEDGVLTAGSDPRCDGCALAF